MFNFPLVCCAWYCLGVFYEESRSASEDSFRVCLWPSVELVLFTLDKYANNIFPILLKEKGWPTCDFKYNPFPLQLCLYLSFRSPWILEFRPFIVDPWNQKLLYVTDGHIAWYFLLWNNDDGELLVFDDFHNPILCRTHFNFLPFLLLVGYIFEDSLKRFVLECHAPWFRI